MKLLLILVALLVIVLVGRGYFFYTERYGTQWDAAAQSSIEEVAVSQADFLQDLYHLQNSPPTPDVVGQAVVKEAHIRITKIENGRNTVNEKTVWAHVTVDALPMLFQNEHATTSPALFAEGDYVFEVSRSFWPAPLLFLPDEPRLSVMWRRG